MTRSMKTLLLCVVLALASLVSLAPASGGENAGRGGIDTTPPVPDFTPKLRQDMHHALKHGIRGTCRTVDNETPVDCRLTAIRKGRQLSSEQVSIVPAFYGAVIDLPITKADRRRLRQANPPVMVKLKLRVTDPAGNSATATKKIELVKGLYD